MQTPRIEHLKLPDRPFRRLRFRTWREWCFLRTIARQLRWRLLIIALVLFGGAAVFRAFDTAGLPWVKAVYYTWSLVFAQPPIDFPPQPALRALYFVMPILGLTVIIEGIVEVSLILRDRRRYERSWCLMMAAHMTNHIVLVGFGKLGYRTFRLLRRLGEPVVVIERDGGNQFLDEVRRDGSPLLIGDARRDELLIEANVAQARSIILASNDDLTNLEVALDARRMRPEIRVVLRMFDQNLADKIRDGFNIHIAMSQSAMSAPAFATAAIDRSIVNSFVIGDRLIVMQRWQIDERSPLAGQTIAQMMASTGASIVERRPRGGAPLLFPPPNARIETGDELLVQGSFEGLLEQRKKMLCT